MIHNYQSAGLSLYFYLEPKDVSFSRIVLGEGFASTQGKGAFQNYPPHAVTNTFGVNGGDATNGCRSQYEDHVKVVDGPYTKVTGTLQWDIPLEYSMTPTGTRHLIRTITHYSEIWGNVNGEAQQTKDSIATIKMKLADPTQALSCGHGI